MTPVEPTSQPIISVSGLRGLIPSQLTPLVVARYVSAFCSKIGEAKVIIARDGRQSGPMLAQAVASTLMANGCHVLDAGVASTPTVGVLVRSLGAKAGIQISASHNPIEYNGMKLFNHEGRVLPAVAGKEILEAYRAGIANWKGVSEIGEYESIADPHAQHLANILEHYDAASIQPRRFRVFLDSNHGAGSLLGERLLEKLGCKVTVAGNIPNGRFAHPPEPTQENLVGIASLVKEGGYDVGFCQDPDADRLAIIDGNGRYIGEEFTVALCLMNALAKKRGPVVINCATSSVNHWIAKEHGVPSHQSAVGEANVVDMMRRENAVFGGEGSGGPIDPTIGWVRDSFVGMASVLELMARTGKTVAELVGLLPQWAMIKSKMELSSERLLASIDKLKSRLEAERVSTEDGIRLDWSDRWILLRGSNTEPIVRLIAEAPTAREAEELIENAKRAIE